MQAQAKPNLTALEVAGERRLRQLLFAVDLLACAAMGAVAFYLWRYWPKGRDVYSELQQGASLTYMSIWAGVALLGALAALRRKTRSISIALTVLVLLECLAHLYFYSANHRFYHPWARAMLDRFEPHPLLSAIPRPSTFGGLSHDAMHRRTTINEGKAGDAKPIYVFGGSSAYDVGVIDSQTWASDLSRLMGPHYEVQNYGVTAYTSLEALIQSLFVFRDIKPVCAVYYEGWNDLISSHVDNLQNDYAPFQTMRVQETLAVDYRPGNITNNWLFLQLIDRAFQQGPGYPPVTSKNSDEKDERLMQIYADNIKLIADIDRHFGVRPIFVPQIVNYEFIESHYGGWWPMSAAAVRPRIHDMNSTMEGAAKEAGAVYLDAPLNLQWQMSDFVDQGHFSAAGSAKFAQAIAPVIAASCK